ncbi:MAG: carboxynorspermidine decarboxylase [Rikenellaceae bacterium]|nr:carboxynorspermidine decarboxylase [Rikenellaceae bacterium]
MHHPVKIPSPCYVVEENLLRSNLELIRDVARRSGAEIILALKANATWKLFSIVREYIDGATASSLAEARLVGEEFRAEAHTYAPVYTDGETEEILRYSSHITFNSIGQFERFGPMALLRGISCGLRVNPGYSPVETCLYNPCSPGSRLGIPHEQLTGLPAGVEGLHFHNLCESGAEELVETLKYFEKYYGHLLPSLKWVNMGGGHLMTRKDYNIELLIHTIEGFRKRNPHLRVILEPGSAFTWQTGYLAATIEDIVYSGGIGTLMVNVSFACHMPDCLEMPYKPAVRGAHEPAEGETRWRIGGNSCLAGDYIGDWAFDTEPKVGDRIIFEDMIHYTMVKTTMFNGVAHPSIGILRADGSFELFRRFGYEDYRDRMA